MTTSHLIGRNFGSDVPKDLEAGADDTIVIDKLLVNKLTELLINSIYSVHVSRRSEIFLTSLDMHLADFSISNKTDIVCREFISTAKAVRSQGARHPRSHPVSNQTDSFVYEFDS
jgi:hypothetical protein